MTGSKINEEKFLITIDPEQIFEKPIPEKIKEWSNRVGSSNAHPLTIEEIAALVGDAGCSFCHAVFDNHWIKLENFRSAQLIVVDIDNKRNEVPLNPHQAIQRLEEYGLAAPNIIYRTLSDPTTNEMSIDEKLRNVLRYRMIFVLDQPVHNLDSFNALLVNGLYLLFPEADHVGPTQKWFGGKETIYLNAEPRFTPSSIISAGNLFSAKNIISNQGRKKKFKKKFKKNSARHTPRGFFFFFLRLRFKNY